MALHHLPHHLPRPEKRGRIVTQRSLVADRRGKDVEGDPAVRGRQGAYDFRRLVDVFLVKV